MEKKPLVKISSYEVQLLQNPICEKSDNWDDTAHHWRISINGVSVSYKTGLAHRTTRRDMRCYNGATTENFNKEPVTASYSLKKYGSFANFIDQTVAKKPSGDDVLYGLVSDVSCGLDTFEEFCANLGYDTDSRKAFETYLACQESVKKLREMKLGKTLNELQEIFQDY